MNLVFIYTNTICHRNHLTPTERHATEIILTDIRVAQVDTRPTYHGNELKGSEELENEFRAGRKTGEVMAGEAGEGVGTEPRRPSHEDGSYEATRCCN